MIGPLYDEVQGPDAGGDAPDVGPIDLGLPKVTPGSGPPTPASIRSRLHVICALYAHTPQPDRRLALLDHLERNKWTYIVGVLGAVGWVANYRQVKGIDEFLDEEGIDRDKYWAPEAWEEKQALREAWEKAFDSEVKQSIQRLEVD